MEIQRSTLIKFSLDCNQRCKYCYEFRRKGTDLSAKLDIANVKVLIQMVYRLFKDADARFQFILHGGEPFLNSMETVEQFLSTLRYYNKLAGKLLFDVGIQTNATLIDDKWLDLLDEYNDLMPEKMLSISIDGPKEINDNVRLYKDGTSTFDTLKVVFDLIKKRSFNFSVVSVIGTHNYNKAQDVYNFIKELNPKIAKFIPCYNTDKDGNFENFGISPIEFSSFLCDMFDLWVGDCFVDNKLFALEPFVSLLMKFNKQKSAYCIYSLEKCDNFLCLYPSGDLFLCENYDIENKPSDVYLGNVYKFSDETFKDVIEHPKNFCDYSNLYDDLMSKCKDCKVFNICSGGCLGYRRELRAKSPKLHDEYCQGEFNLYEHIRNALIQANVTI